MTKHIDIPNSKHVQVTCKVCRQSILISVPLAESPEELEAQDRFLKLVICDPCIEKRHKAQNSSDGGGGIGL